MLVTPYYVHSPPHILQEMSEIPCLKGREHTNAPPYWPDGEVGAVLQFQFR